MESRRMGLMNLFPEQQWRHRHREQTYRQGLGRRGRGWDEWKSSMDAYTLTYVHSSQWQFAVWLRELKLGLCNNLEGENGQEVGGRFKREGISVRLWSWETLDWKKHKLESRLPGEISITSDMQMTPPLWQKVKKHSKASWWKWKWRVKKLA